MFVLAVSQTVQVGIVAVMTAGVFFVLGPDMVSGLRCSQAIEAYRVSATLPRKPRGALQGALCGIGRRMVISATHGVR